MAIHVPMWMGRTDSLALNSISKQGAALKTQNCNLSLDEKPICCIYHRTKDSCSLGESGPV